MNSLRSSRLLCRAAAASFVRSHPPARLCGAAVHIMHRLRGPAVTRGALRPVRPDSTWIEQEQSSSITETESFV